MRRWQIPSSCRMRQLPQGSSFQAAEAQSMLFLRATNSKGFVACSPTLAKALSSAQAELPAKVCLHVCWSKNWRAVGTSRLSRVSIYLSMYLSTRLSTYLFIYLVYVRVCCIHTYSYIYIIIYMHSILSSLGACTKCTLSILHRRAHGSKQKASINAS